MEKLLRNINPKRSTGIDLILPEFILLSPEMSSTLLFQAFNNPISTRKLWSYAKVSIVSPLDQHTENKYSISNSPSPFSVINNFSKMQKF